MLKIAILGLGVRGNVFAAAVKRFPQKAVISALCDPDETKLKDAAEQYGVALENCYLSDEAFFKSGKKVDGVIICSKDSSHFRQAMRAIELGCNVLLEKPISSSVEECEKLLEATRKADKHISVCHVLRYSVFYQKLKEIICSGIYGDIVGISQTETVGYYHYVHSYVRGTWRKERDCGPIILTKSCHDLDIIGYLVGTKCMSVVSHTGRKFFSWENKPEGTADYCYKCLRKNECIYNCISFYQKNHYWLKRTGVSFDYNDENIREWLSDESNIYSRCVFASDNDVAEHQTVNMMFENGVNVQFLLTAFSAKQERTITIHCTNSEIYGNTEENKITVKQFGKKEVVLDLSDIEFSKEHHGGGDTLLLKDFLLTLEKNPSAQELTDISKSIISHRIAAAAEKSRKSGGIPIMMP